MLVRRPKRVIAKVAGYDIIVASDNDLEESAKFDGFCQEFKTVLMMFAKAANDAKKDIIPTVAHEGVS